jgi:uncharacterized membrane protein YeaQ/YmgE (transglycosylase-associated protein family)
VALGIFIALIVLFIVLPIVGVALWFVISTAITGLFFGALGRLIVPGQQPIGALATVVCGWVGALIGGAIGRGVWGYHSHRFATVLIEIGVAAVAVIIWSGGSRRRIRQSGGPPHRVIDI